MQLLERLRFAAGRLANGCVIGLPGLDRDCTFFSDRVCAICVNSRTADMRYTTRTFFTVSLGVSRSPAHLLLDLESAGQCRSVEVRRAQPTSVIAKEHSERP